MRLLIPFSLAMFAAVTARAGVLINEFHASPNEILLDYDASGNPRLGYGPMWWETAFDDTAWSTGLAPLGHSTTGLGTTVAGMDDRTPSLYARRTFTLSAADAQRTTDLILRVWYDDGFVAWINGREAARANLGPARQFTYHHQVPYRAATETMPVEYNLGPVNQWLATGGNVLAVQGANRTLGDSFRIDAALLTMEPSTGETVAEFTHAGSNGAFRTHQNTGGVVSNNPTGVPPAGSWLALAPDPVSDPLWQSLTIQTVQDATAGVANGGAVRWVFTATGTTRAAAVFGPPVPLGAAGSSGPLTEDDLQRTDISFRYRVSSGASFAFRADPAAGTAAQALSGLPVVSASGAGNEDAPRDYSTNRGGARSRIVGPTGSATTSSSGIVVSSPVLTNGPLLRNAAFRLMEDNVAGNGAGGSAGAMRMEWTDPADTTAEEDWFQVALPGYTVRSWTAGSVTAADLGRVNLVFQHRLAAGRTFRVFLEPDNAAAGFNDRADFGTVTGTGSWEVFDQPFSAATNTSAMLTRINALTTTTFRLTFRADASLPVGEPIWIDNAGFSTLWRTWSGNLGAATAASRTAFLAALNAAGSRTFVPALARTAGATAPAQDELVVDDFRVTRRVSGGALTWVGAATGGWRWFVGRCEPSGGLTDPARFADPLYDGDLHDWVELHNDGAAAVDLGGWSLTDDAGQPRKWLFPAGTLIPAGGHLVVICDGLTTPLPGARFLHANFELSSSGEYLALRDASGSVASEFMRYPAQNAFHTFGRRPGGGPMGWLRHGTPGSANSGPFFEISVEAPQFSIPGGFHATTQTLSMSCATPGALIRYTTDGSDPSETSILYTTPLTLGALGPSVGHCIRARAFVAGSVASPVTTATYLINQDSRLRSAPALVMTGDPGRALFLPHGAMAISGGVRASNGVWTANTPTDYNNVLGDLNNALTGGQAWERPLHIELLNPSGAPGFSAPGGFRVSGSGHARPRYTLAGIQNAPWSYTAFADKPSFNLFFRGEYGVSGVRAPLFPQGYPVDYFEQFRVRAGKNDVSNPFIRDEYVRRLYIAMGRRGSRGIINTLYVNGRFRGTYNMTERLREPFMQQHFGGSEHWDVRQVTDMGDGDAVAFDSFKSLLDAYRADSANQLKFDAAMAQLDAEAFADYALLNIWAGTGDWPHNNWVASRERSATGRWRWFVWDAEGAFGGFSKHLGYNVIAQDLTVNPTALGREPCRVYESLSQNPEFRLLLADRINRHFCNGGALTDARLSSVLNGVAAEYQQLFNYMFPTGTLNLAWFTQWVHATNLDKRDVLFRSAVFDDPTTSGVNDPKEFGYQFPKANIWPAVDGQGTWNAPLPPLLSQHGGDVPAGFSLTILHTEVQNDRAQDAPYRAAAAQNPAGRVVHYTLDGSDPRLRGGVVRPGALTASGPVILPNGLVSLRSRIRDTATGQWSPLTAAEFRVGVTAPTADNLVIAEIMYNPPDVTAAESGYTNRDDFEFLRVMNVGVQPVRLSDCRFTVGVTFDFSQGTIPVLNAGASAVVVANAQAFRMRYGAAFDYMIAGEFNATGLSNGGERLRLETSTGTTIRDFAYDDAAPWPVSPDGGGPSLVLRAPHEVPDHGNPANWVASAVPGGLAPFLDGEVSYARWRSLFWGAADAAVDQVSGMTADPDNDGLTNLAEYALGLNPRESSPFTAVPFIAEQSGGRVVGIEFRMRRGAVGVSVVPEHSADLGAWAAAPEWSPPVPQADGSAVYRHAVPEGVPGGNLRRFLRVRVASP